LRSTRHARQGAFCNDTHDFPNRRERVHASLAAYYAFDIVPSFWPKIVELAADGRIVTVDSVRDEILRGRDRLAGWIITDFPQSAIAGTKTDPSVVQAVGAIMNWVYGPGQVFTPDAIHDFAGGADPWPIAYAIAHNSCVVTHETFKPEIRRKVPIPNVCQAFGVAYVNTFSMMRDLSVSI